MFCFHFVAGNRLSRNRLYWSFASRAMFIGSAFSPAFLPASSAMLDRSGARSLCGWSSSSAGRSYLSGWVYHFRCRLPCIPSIHSTTQSTACLFSAGGGFRTRILHERSPLPKFCGLSAVRIMWCDAKTRRVAPHYLPRQKRSQTINTYSNTLKNTSLGF